MTRGKSLLKLRLLLGMQAVVELDKLVGQGGSRVSIMHGGNGELMSKNSCTEVELLNKGVGSNRQERGGCPEHGAQLRQPSLVKPWGLPQV